MKTVVYGDSLRITPVVRPFVALIIVFVISIPFISKYSNTLNYNDLFEVDNKYESKMGINVIEEHFPPGFLHQVR